MSDNDSSTNNPQVPPDDDWLKEAADWWSEALSEAGAGFRRRLDRDARKASTNAPEQVDPTLFNTHVTPDLEAAIKGYASFIRLGMADYQEAFDHVRQFAWRRGGWGLSPDHWDDLLHWIHDRLGSAIGPES